MHTVREHGMLGTYSPRHPPPGLPKKKGLKSARGPGETSVAATAFSNHRIRTTVHAQQKMAQFVVIKLPIFGQKDDSGTWISLQKAGAEVRAMSGA